MKKYLLIIILLPVTFLCRSQEKANVDSLLKILPGLGKDTLRVNTLIELANYYLDNVPSKAVTYSGEAITLSDKLNWHKGSAKAHYAYGFANTRLGKFDLSLEHWNKAYAFYRKSGDEHNALKVMSNIGGIYIYLARYPLALEYLFEALKLAEAKDSKKIIANTLNNIGLVYEKLNDQDKALTYYSKCLSHAEKNKDESLRSSCLHNMANVYARQKKHAEAIEHYNQAITILEKTNRKNEMASTLADMGSAYSEAGNQDKGLEYVLKSYSINKELKNVKSVIYNLVNLGVISERKGDIQNAKKYHLEALELLVANPLAEAVRDVNLGLSKIYEAENDYVKAHQHYRKYIATRDSIDNLSNQKEINRRELNYEYEKKSALEKAEFDKQQAIAQIEIEKNRLLLRQNEQDIKLLAQENELKALTIFRTEAELKQKMTDAENQEKAIELLNKDNALKAAQALQKEEQLQKQRIATYSAIGGGGLVFVLLVLAFRGYKSKQRSNRIIMQQKHEVEQQKEITEQQKHLVEEKNREILDSITYAKRLQEAILPPLHLTQEYFNDAFILYKPKDIVAGDFYWMESRDGIIYFAAADCTGHGVPGAMVSVVCSNALNRAVKEFNITRPGEVLDKVRELVIETFEQSANEVKDGMDISFCALNPATRHLLWAGANNPLWIIRKGHGEIEEIKANKQPIGKMDIMQPFTTHERVLAPGDNIYLFSDGFSDQFGGENGKKFKSANFKKLLLSIKDENMQAQRRLIDESFEAWKSNYEQIDDVCVIGVKL